MHRWFHTAGMCGLPCRCRIDDMVSLIVKCSIDPDQLHAIGVAEHTDSHNGPPLINRLKLEPVGISVNYIAAGASVVGHVPSDTELALGVQFPSTDVDVDWVLA